MSILHSSSVSLTAVSKNVSLPFCLPLGMFQYVFLYGFAIKILLSLTTIAPQLIGFLITYPTTYCNTMLSIDLFRLIPHSSYQPEVVLKFPYPLLHTYLHQQIFHHKELYQLQD